MVVDDIGLVIKGELDKLLVLYEYDAFKTQSINYDLTNCNLLKHLHEELDLPLSLNHFVDLTHKISVDTGVNIYKIAIDLSNLMVNLGLEGNYNEDDISTLINEDKSYLNMVMGYALLASNKENIHILNYEYISGFSYNLELKMKELKPSFIDKIGKDITKQIDYLKIMEIFNKLNGND
jgi:hypothetical protein